MYIHKQVYNAIPARALHFLILTNASLNLTSNKLQEKPELDLVVEVGTDTMPQKNRTLGLLFMRSLSVFHFSFSDTVPKT